MNGSEWAYWVENMVKILLSILICVFPVLVLADSSLSFAPPPSDYSVVFLGNIFGIVDGVLSGTGSQIMGAMFSIFNSAVLAIGGIILMYTGVVSTLNTAHEGQMLGQKWSSIWVPVRSTLGLALLIPKASGYCMMQIFVMWVVLQGVGAADKVWEAALSYLNRGGVIVQAQVDPIASIMGDKFSIAKGGSKILTGQVCMFGLQTALNKTRDGYLKEKSAGSGPCLVLGSDIMKKFCTTSIPDFLSTVDPVNLQQQTSKTATVFKLPMPNFDEDSLFYALNGKCGSIEWNALTAEDTKTINTKIDTLSQSERDTILMSRAIAIEALYTNLSYIAQTMVKNSPALSAQAGGIPITGLKPFPNIVAQEPFGVPMLDTGEPCTEISKNCTGWASDFSGMAALFTGTQFQGAIAAYNAAMMPTLNLIKQANSKDGANEKRKFIKGAVQKGWIMAGSYFIDLAKINATTGVGQANMTDKGSGLEGSSVNLTALTVGFQPGSGNSTNSCLSDKELLCKLFNADPEPINQIIGLINGKTILSAPVVEPNLDSLTDHPPVSGLGSSTVYGFVNNSVMVQLPGQPGLTTFPKFAMKINMQIPPILLPDVDFDCGRVLFVCFGRFLGDLFYNKIIKNVLSALIFGIAKFINLAVIAFLTLPLLGMSQIFIYGVSFIQKPTVNPIIALANMGVNYINFASELWIYLMELAILQILLPFGWFIIPLLLMVMPLLLAWLGMMVSIGFITAYYIPFMPYMIFTFGSIAWLMAVIEAMVAAPIVALGVTHPEGEGAFGKAEQAIMILLNVFLRPAMMIIGFIAAISLSYVSVWVINAGFSNVVTIVQGDPNVTFSGGLDKYDPGKINTTTGYSSWAGIYGFFFSILIYTIMYVTVVQKAFTLITYLPDKVLRWIGGQPEGIGQEATQWVEEGKGKVEKAGDATAKASGAMGKQLGGALTPKPPGGGGGGKVGGGSGPSSTPSSPD